MADERPDAPIAPPPPGEAALREFPRYPRPRRPVQFSLRTLLIVMTAVAIGVVVLSALGVDFVIGLAAALIVFATPVCCVTAAIYMRGRWQTFFVGAAVIACLATSNLPPRLTGPGDIMVLGLSYLFTMVLGGGVALATRWLIERRRWHLPPDQRSPWIDD
jgi:hypothetical protein